MPSGSAQRVVIAGAGQAGFQVAAALRSEGFDGSITLIGDEPWLPYQRPPLSKACLAGKQDIDATALRPESFYQEQTIDVITGDRVNSIDRSARQVTLASGRTLFYSKLVLAVGARNRLLPIAGADLDGVCYLRTRDEASAVGDRLRQSQRVVVIGGGFIGLEVAAAASTLGKQVVVVEAQDRLMSRAVAPIMSEYFRQLHVRHGVGVALQSSTRELLGTDGRVSQVVLDEGAILPVDLVVVGIGVVPNIELASGAGLDVSNGIVVDAHLRTADDNIYAIGDCAQYPNRYAGCTVRLESVQNAVDQARCVAASIAGNPRLYDAVPWFWTDQFECKLQMVGLPLGCDMVIPRGAPESGKFSVCYFKGDRLLAIDSVNRPGDHLAGRKLLAAGKHPTPEQAADLTFDLKTLLASNF